MKPLYFTKIFWILLGIGLIAVGYADVEPETLGDSTKTITGSVSGLTKLITAGSYIAGLAFTHNAILRFKQHKENPTQVSLGQAVGVLLIALSFLFFPSIMSSLGITMFGNTAKTAGPRGMIWCPVKGEITDADKCYG